MAYGSSCVAREASRAQRFRRPLADKSSDAKMVQAVYDCPRELFIGRVLNRAELLNLGRARRNCLRTGDYTHNPSGV